MKYKAILTDIEGTTSSISFVKDVLFPYAYEQMEDFVLTNLDKAEVQVQLKEAAELAGLAPENTAAIIAQLLRWIDEDKKITPLKQLQGMIWESGYKTGAYKAHMYADATEHLKKWHENGLPLYVYSSGSVYAQKLFFEYSEAGNLLQLFSGHFDTKVGGKKEVHSYQAISKQLDIPAKDILFLTDILEEYQTAQSAGFAVALVCREGAELPSGVNAVRDFSELSI